MPPCAPQQLDAGTECFDLIHGSPSADAKVAIASVWDGGEGYKCAVPLWCQGATRLTALVPDAELVLVSPKVSEDCMHAVHVHPTRTVAASTGYLQRHGFGSAHTRKFDVSNLLKVALFSLEQYQLLLYVDLDIDLKPQLLTREAWAQATEGLLASSALFVGLFDHASPVNGGLWLVRPRRWLHRQSLQLLRHGSWTAERGFDGVGSPRQIALNRTLMAPLLERIAAGSAASLFKVEGVLNYTQYFRFNSWNFVNGHLDQGLLWWLFFLRNDVGTWSHYSGGKGKRGHKWDVLHYWGGGRAKPWQAPASPHGRHTPLHAVTCRHMPSHAVTCRCTPWQAPANALTSVAATYWRSILTPAELEREMGSAPPGRLRGGYGAVTGREMGSAPRDGQRRRPAGRALSARAGKRPPLSRSPPEIPANATECQRKHHAALAHMREVKASGGRFRSGGVQPKLLSGPLPHPTRVRKFGEAGQAERRSPNDRRLNARRSGDPVWGW